MSPTQYIYLVPSYEDEGAWDEHDWIEYPGRVTAGVLSKLLQELGCKVDEIYSEGEKGWEFGFTYKRTRLHFRVGKIEDIMIVLWVRGAFDFFGRKKREFDELLERLGPVLNEDGRFSNIRWYTQKQMDSLEWDYPGKDDEEAGA